MAKRYVETCDRCGRELDGFLLRITRRKFNALKVLKHWSRDDPYAYFEQTYDYCRDCAKAVEAALEGREGQG